MILDSSNLFLEDWEEAKVNSVTVKCIYNRPFSMMRELEEGVELTAPEIVVDEGVDASHGDLVEIGEDRFRVYGIEPDGLGLKRLRIRREVE